MFRFLPLIAPTLFLSVAAVPLSAELTNVVLQRPAVVSSQLNASHPAWAAVDGDSAAGSRRWISANTPLPAWIEVSLEGYYNVSQFKFWTGASGNYSHPLTGFQLQSWDGNQWQVVHGESNYPNSGIVDISFPEQLASNRIRMFFTAGSDNQVRLYELEVYGEPYVLQTVQQVPEAGGSTYRPQDPITVQFNANVVAVNTGLIAVRTLPGMTPVTINSVSVTNDLVSIAADLQFGQTYEVVIPQGALALQADPAKPNPPIFWNFTTLPITPQVVQQSNSIGTTEPIEIVFDRPVQLLDGDAVSLINLETGTVVDLLSVATLGEVLTLTHAGIAENQRLMLRMPANVLHSPDSGANNDLIELGLFSGVIELLPVTGFATGLEGFIPAHVAGVIPLTTRVWDWLAGSNPSWSEMGPGPSGDFSWVGRDRGPSEDFIATPALEFVAGEEYTLSFLYEGALRIDMQSTLTSPDREQTPMATTPILSTGSRKVTFTAENSGLQHLFFSSTASAWQWNRLDNIGVVRTVRPAIYMDSPEMNLVMPENEALVISGSAFGFSAELQNVKIYLDDRLVGTFTRQDFELIVTDFDPGAQDVRIVALDKNGVETEEVIPITITFPDGSLPNFIQYSFRTGLDGVYTNADWRPEDTGYLNFHTRSGNMWMSTPCLFLQAGESYLVQFLASKAEVANKTLHLSLEDQPGMPVNPVPLVAFDINSEEWVLYQTVIDIEFNGGYHITLYHVGQDAWRRLKIDNFRVVGLLNSAPAVSFVEPANNTRTLAGAPIRITANASDADGHVTRVEFWNGSFLIGTVYEPPYSLLWESAPVGDITVTALAYDNANAVSNPATVQVQSLENRVSIATNMGSSSVLETIRGMAYQQDGTLVVGGVINPDFFADITPVLLPSAAPGDNGVIVRMSEDGRTVLSVTVVAEAVADISLDSADNIYIAAGSAGILKLNADADALVWNHTPADMGIAHKLAHRIDAAANGMTAALMSPTTNFGDQALAAGDVALVHPDGTLHPALMAGSGGTYTTDIAVDTELERVWIAGWKNFRTVGEPTGGPTFPVDVPIFVVRSYASDNFNERLIRGYDWESGDDNGRWLNRLDNNMADTRTQRVTIAPNGDVYIGLEYDGGNTPIRYDPYDLSKTVQLVGGDQYHNNAFTSTVPKVAVIRLDRLTGAFKTGQYMTNRLSSGADNTVRLRGGELLVDAVGRVHVVGDSAAGTPLTFDVLPGVYNGGAVHWVLSPDLSTREMVTRWATNGSLNTIAISPNGRVAVGGELTGDRMYRRRAMLSERQNASDALLVVGDFSGYYSFQPGNHPRLFFTAQDVPELRYRATLVPFSEMVQVLIDSLEHDGDYNPFNPDLSYHRSMRAKINAFLYVITGDEDYAIAAREDVEWVIAGNQFAWADPNEMGLRSYSLGTRVALAYDWCAMSPHWDDAFLFHVSKSLLDMAKVIINNGGTQQNTSHSSNWQGARGSSGGLALLATDSRYDPALLNAAYERVRRYINEAFGAHPETRGWAGEGIGYTYYPFGLFVGPFGEAMARLGGRDLRAETAISAAYRSLMTAPTAAVNVYDFGGIKPDWANDNMHMRGEGIYGQSFYYLDPSLWPAARWIYDRIQGPLSRDRARWDDTRGGTIWTFLHYPVDVPEQSPLEFHAWHSANVDQHGIGITTFRNQYEDENDILAQFKARLFTAGGGHDGPDGLGFRIIGNDTAWVVGGGRDDPGKRTSQPTLYTVEPGSQLSSTLVTGELVGTPLVKVDGGGHVIARMDNNNVGVANHKRWFMTDFDSAATGAQAAFLVADTSLNATFWQLPTSPFNTITTSGNTFTITSPNGDTLQGTVLHPAGATLNHGTRSRGSAFAPLFGGSLADVDPVLNPFVSESKFVTVQGTGGDFLITLTIQPAGEAHPAVSRTSGTVADAVVQIGSRSYTITTDDILYDGQLYTHADALIAFDIGSGSLIEGEIHQTIAYGGSPLAPVVEPPAGYVFLGWSHAFEAVTRSMTIEAVYAPIEGTPAAPSFLRGTAPTGGFIALQWNDNSIGETGFTVEESNDGGQSWTVAATLPENSTGVTLSGRAPLSQFHYRVRAEGTEAPSGWSNTLVLNTPALNQSPFFTSTPPTWAHEGAQFNYFIQAEDPEEDSMLLALVQGPEWLSLYNSGGGAAVLTGIPVADTDTVDVTVSVSDGINPAVEQSFTLSINAAPAINLIWPGSLPVYLSARHGIYVEAEVIDDDAPVTVTWTVVQGPTGTVIDDPHALETGIYFDRAGTYAVRITAVDALGARSEMEFPVLVDRQVSGELAEVLAFDQANEYVTAATHFRNVAPSSQNLDIDGDGITDTRRFHAFSTTAPLNPVESAGIHGGRFYGGYLVERFSGTNFVWQTWPGFTAGASIAMRFNSPYPSTVDWVLYWLREDFKDVEPEQNVFLGPQSSLRIDIQESTSNYLDVGQIRWLVLANDKFYVSQTVIANTLLGRTLNGTQLTGQMWAEYNPVAPIALNFDQANASFTTTTQELGPIQGVGFLADADDTSFNRRFRLIVDGFFLEAEVIDVMDLAPIISMETVPTTEAGTPAALEATVEFSGEVGASIWSVVYGPGSVTFGDETSPQTTVTASLPGEYRLRLSAWDDGQSSFREVVWIVDPAEGPDLTALEQWRAAQFGHLTGGVNHPDAALLADPGGDGIANLLEFALGGSPLIPSSAQLPEQGAVEIDGQRYLTLSVPRNPDAADLAFVVEVSDDLAAWRSTPGEDVVILTDTPSLLEVRSAQPIGPGTPQFIRLRVEKAQ